MYHLSRINFLSCKKHFTLENGLIFIFLAALVLSNAGCKTVNLNSKVKVEISEGGDSNGTISPSLLGRFAGLVYENDLADRFKRIRGANPILSDLKYIDQNNSSEMDFINNTNLELFILTNECNDGSQVAIFHNPKSNDIIVSFRGTNMPYAGFEDSMKDWLLVMGRDFILEPDSLNLVPGKVHSGFLRAFQCLMPEISAEILRISSRPTTANQNPSAMKVHLTGHSLGGALAILYGIHLRKSPDPNQLKQIVVFSTPAMANAQFKQNAEDILENLYPVNYFWGQDKVRNIMSKFNSDLTTIGTQCQIVIDSPVSNIDPNEPSLNNLNLSDFRSYLKNKMEGEYIKVLDFIRHHRLKIMLEEFPISSQRINCSGE